MIPTFEAVVPKDPKKISVQAHLTPDEYKDFHAMAEKKDWSDKKLNENIVKLFMKEVKKNPKRLEDL